MTAIEWTDATWNPVTGCDRVSPGCKHCYALDLAARLKRMGQPRYQRDGQPPTSGPGFGVTLHEDKLDEPLRWRKPRMVFVNSMSDLFHPEIPDEFIARVFATMALVREHTFQVLTKRPERMREFFTREVEEGVGWLPGSWAGHAIRDAMRDFVSGYEGTLPLDAYTEAEQGGVVALPLPNVWLGTSIESRTYVGRADHLRHTPAAVRFISAEPLLGPLGCETPDDRGEGTVEGLDLDRIDWLIVGGESGRTHRRIDPEWVRDLRDSAMFAGTAFFFKQWGGRTPKAGGRVLDGRTWDEYPQTQEAVAV